jgi:hypothetical protein
MITRSDLRNACYRAKKNVAEPRHQALLDMILPLLAEHQRWDNFPSVWDLLIKGDEIKIITPESDFDYIHNTLLEISLYTKKGMFEISELDDRQLNIYTIVDIIMLEGVMKWETYNKTWGVAIDPELNQIRTIQYNVKSSQIEVTDEMIQSSMKDADGNALTAIPSIPETVFDMKPMEDSQKGAFEEFLKRKYS